MAGLERVEDRALGRPFLRIQKHLAVDAGERAEVVRERDPDHSSVCASTDSTAGRSRMTAVQLSPPSAEA